jgi:hypothetical protein
MKNYKWPIWLAWAAWGLIGWLALVVIVNGQQDAGSLSPGQLKKQGLDQLPPGLLKKLLGPPTPTPTPTGTPPLTGFGALIQGVTPQEKAAWGAGRVQFQVVETPATGLGPLFNGQSCQQCHGQPQVNGINTVGGPAPNIEIHFLSATFGADLFHLSSISPVVQDVIPTDSTVIAARKSNTTAGLGLIESISDADIIANAQTGADGVFGRPAMLNDPVTRAAGPNRVGRFGWKAQHASTLAFAGDALINELGITNRLFGTDLPPHTPNGFASLTAAEPQNHPNNDL